MAAKLKGPLQPLYIADTAEHGGKSAISLGLCLALRNHGLKVGYFKPLGILARQEEDLLADTDALQAKEVLDLPDTIDDICPVILSAQVIDDVVSGRTTLDPASQIESAFARIAAGRDIVVMEGVGELIGGSFLGLNGAQITNLLGAKALLVARYGETAMLDRILAGQFWLKQDLLGVIFNFVPRGRLSQAEVEYTRFLNVRGIEVFGSIKSDPRLSAVTVKSVMKKLKAELLCAERETGRLAETMLVGAMNQEHALRYFQRVAHKLVVTGGDRGDIILAALETPTAAVVLTGNIRPAPSIVGRAEELGVPLLLTGLDTLSAINEIKQLFGRLRVKEKSKVELITKLIEEYVDLQRLTRKLKLSPEKSRA